MEKAGRAQTEDAEGLPSGWRVERLGDLANIQRGASPRPIDADAWYDRESRVGWVRISDVSASDGKNLFSTTDYFSARGIANSRYLPGGSLIMSICATVGMPVITRIDACIHDGFVGFTGLRRVDQEFLYYKLKELEPTFKGLGQTGSQANLNSDLVRGCPIALPPLPEQRAIAAALSDVDALLGALDGLVVKKRDLKQAAMQQLLTGQTRLPGFSGKWETKRLGTLFAFLRTANNPRSDLNTHSDVGYIHYGDIHTRASAFLDCATASLPRIDGRRMIDGAARVEDGDLVMADASEDYAGIGKCLEVRGVGKQHVIAGLHTFLLRASPADLAHGFKGYLQFIPAIRGALVRLATGISVYGISKSNVRNVEIAVPAPREQAAIASVLLDMDAELAALEQRRDKTRLLKQGMMQELLTGRTRLV